MTVVVQSTGERLPEWGFQQYEVVTERDLESSSVLWSIDEVILPDTDDTALWEEEEKGGCGLTWPSH